MKRSQAEAILKELRRYRGKYLPMPRLAKVAGCYVVATRVSDLRRAGYKIKNRTERYGAHVVKSFYRLER